MPFSMNSTITNIIAFFRFLAKRILQLRYNKDVFIFIGFFFLASCFWVLNALRKDNFTNELKYPIRFTNVDDHWILEESNFNELTLTVKADGLDLLRYHFLNKIEVKNIDVSKMKRFTNSSGIGAYAVTKDYMRIIASQLRANSNMELLKISPDTLYLSLIEKNTKKVPVVPQVTVSFNKLCQLSDRLILDPDSVIISGPQSFIDSTHSVLTSVVSFTELKDTLVTTIPLLLSKDVSCSFKKVKLTIPVEHFTESFTMVPVIGHGLADGWLLKTFPSEVKVSYRVGLTRNLYTSSDFNAIIDFSSLDMSNLPPRLKITLNHIPKGVSSVTYSPVFVEYLIEKNKP